MFEDRAAAGRELLLLLEVSATTTLCAIPTGGCVVAGEIARALELKVRTLITTKIRSPIAPELALGAVAPDGEAEVDPTVTAALGVTSAQLEHYVRQARDRVRERIQYYKGHVASPADISGRQVIIVDDGIATGHTVAAAIRYVIRHDPAQVTVAVPVASPEAAAALGRMAEVVAVSIPSDFVAVGRYYRNFEQLTDQEALAAMSSLHGEPRYRGH